MDKLYIEYENPPIPNAAHYAVYEDPEGNISREKTPEESVAHYYEWTYEGDEVKAMAARIVEMDRQLAAADKLAAAQMARIKQLEQSPISTEKCPVCGEGPVTRYCKCRACESVFAGPEEMRANKAAQEQSRLSTSSDWRECNRCGLKFTRLPEGSLWCLRCSSYDTRAIETHHAYQELICDECGQVARTPEHRSGALCWHRHCKGRLCVSQTVKE